MLGDITAADEIYIVCGYTDMRRAIDGLCAVVQDKLHMDPRRRALYLFCGKRCDRIKALLWEGDGFLLLYKRMEAQGRFRWPRNSEEVRTLTWQQFDWLMSGLEIEQLKAFRISENIERIVKKYSDMVRKEKPNVPTQIYPHMLRRTRASGWYRDGVPIETIAVILGHSDTKTTRKSYARPSIGMLRKEMAKGNPPELQNNGKEEMPLWTNDEELARLCGIR